LEGQELAARHIALREQAGLTQEQEAKMAGVSPTTISGIESGKITRPHLKTLLKIARALGVDVGKLRESGKVAPPSPQQSFNGLLEEERLAGWRTAVRSARQLRETARARMGELLGAWRASKERQADADKQREYLDEMGELLQESYEAERALRRNFPEDMTPQARRAVEEAGGRWVLNNDWEELFEASRFYGELIGMVRNAGFRVEESGSEPPRVKEAA
jgi:transcriptional regulator with XRE-family HTH domain